MGGSSVRFVQLVLAPVAVANRAATATQAPDSWDDQRLDTPLTAYHPGPFFTLAGDASVEADDVTYLEVVFEVRGRPAGTSAVYGCTAARAT